MSDTLLDAIMKNEDNCTAHSLCGTAEKFLTCHLTPIRWLKGGDEALVLHVQGPEGPLVLHGSSPRLSCVELMWSHAVARHAHHSVPQVVIPLDIEGRTLFKWRGRHVAVYPFVAGNLLDRDDRHFRKAAAELLAKLHLALLDWTGGPRPLGQCPIESVALPSDLLDGELDDWWRINRASGVVTTAIHGDYYERNLLCSADAITGVIDWHDATVAPLAMELAGATFAFCRDTEHALEVSKANNFVASYRAAGGPISENEVASLVHFIRLWLRRDVALNLISGSETHDSYIREQIRAFTQLAQFKWKPE